LAEKAECFNERGLFNPYSANENLARYWAIPGTEGLEHRVGGLEKHPVTGAISYSPEDHAAMGSLRAQRVERASELAPTLLHEGADECNLLVLAWGSNAGKVREAVTDLHNEGLPIAYATIDMINPLQPGLQQLMARYTRVLVCESNSGQLASHLRSITEHKFVISLASMEAKPFSIDELKAVICNII
jgi:2-oxoglutarate ferredoxin oxidoreductase subunit alpha